MSCHICAKKFGFLEKELGCPECGFSCCKKCLKYEFKDPKAENTTRKRCSKCHIKHIKMEPSLDGMDEYAQKFRSCIETMCQSNTDAKYEFKDEKVKFGTVREAFDHETQKLHDRLKALDEDYKKKLPKLKTDQEIADWLNRLEDKPSTSTEPTKVYQPPDRRTETECSDQLLQQYTEEAKLDKGLPDPVQELEARLARLRGEDVPSSKERLSERAERKQLYQSVEEESQSSSKRPSKGIWGLDLPSSNHSDDEDAAAEAIVKKALLDVEAGKLDLDEDEETEDLQPTTLPWCVICNENATLKCLGCDGDLYCDACFIECCKSEEHVCEPFVPQESHKSSSQDQSQAGSS